VKRGRLAVIGGRVGLGLVGGAAYGSVLRGWMRFVSDDPDFSWSGTLFIVGAFTLAGGCVGLVAAGRARGWRGALLVARIVACVVGMGCFGGAGLLMFPTVVPAGLAAGRRSWHPVVRVLLVLVAAGVAVLVVLTLPEISPARKLLALAIYGACCTVEALALGSVLAPSVAPATLRARLGSWGRPVMVLAGAGAAGLLVLSVVGV
jgi:hypothetical protein